MGRLAKMTLQIADNLQSQPLGLVKKSQQFQIFQAFGHIIDHMKRSREGKGGVKVRLEKTLILKIIDLGKQHGQICQIIINNNS